MGSAPQLIILKTTAQHIEGVTKNQKHALRGRIVNARRGDLLLIAEMQTRGPALIRYGMRFDCQYPDQAGDSEAIWGKRWDYIVSGEGGCWLTKPFAPAQAKPQGPYGQGGTLVYVPARDAEEFVREGRLAPIL